MNEFETRALALLERIARDTKTTRENISKFTYAMIEEAEKEVPESMRRYMNYMHDIHDVTYMYEERGIEVPRWILSEMERCDDRLRQMLQKLHANGGVFEKIRREMAEDVENRWDHTKQLSYLKKEKTDETMEPK